MVLYWSNSCSVLGICISEERNMLIAEKFIHLLVEKYGKQTAYTDERTWYEEKHVIYLS
jgi:hypothetical protein